MTKKDHPGDNGSGTDENPNTEASQDQDNETAEQASTDGGEAAAAPADSPSEESVDAVQTPVEAPIEAAKPDADAGADPPVEPDAEAETEATAEIPKSWDSFKMPDALRRALEGLGWTGPTPVQALCFDKVCGGTDVLVQSQTGTGKTGAFLLPWVANVFEAGDAADTGVQLLVLTPTRELAKQVCTVLEQLAADSTIVALPIYGGTAMQPQLAALRRGVHAVVGTPGRILDHIRRRSLDLSKVRMAVLDEADEMLSMGFLEDIHSILDACSKERQTCLFSATVPPDIERIARRYMRNPEEVMLSGDQVAAAEIEHVYYQVGGAMKIRDLLDIIDHEEPRTGLIFCNTREQTTMVASALRREGFAAEPLSSDLTQAARSSLGGSERSVNSSDGYCSLR